MTRTDPTEHALVLQLDEELYHLQPHASCDIFDNFAARIAVNRESIYCWKAKQ